MLLAGISALAGCYATVPVTSVPAPGETVLLDLTDRGRLQLGDQIGPSATRIEGIIEAPSDSVYLLRVSEVSYLNGQHNKWSGERLSVPSSLVATAQTRSFSRARTTAVGGGIVGAVILLFVHTNFFGRSTGDKQSPPPPGGNT